MKKGNGPSKKEYNAFRADSVIAKMESSGIFYLFLEIAY